MDARDRAIMAAIIVALDDPEGVNYTTYEQFLNLANFLPDFGTPIFDSVEATDGRYYLPLGVARMLFRLYNLSFDTSELTTDWDYNV